MDPRKTTLNDAINTAAEVAVARAANSKKAARAKRAEKWAEFVAETIADFGIALVSAYPLMLGLDSFGISAPFWGCFALATALRWTLNSSIGSGSR